MALSKQQKIDLWDDFEKKTQSGGNSPDKKGNHG